MISLDVPQIRVLRSKSEIGQSVANLIDDRVIADLAKSGVFHLALTGGSLGILISELLVSRWNEAPDKYVGLHLWWGDERFVPELSADRNAHPVLLGLGEGSPIHVHQSLPSDSHVELEEAVKRYGLDLLGIDMDLTLLGIGPDGHVASLFPGQWDENEKRGVIAVHDSPKPPLQRISFSMFKINASNAVWFVASGEEKREVLTRIMARDALIPATYAHGRLETLLFTDQVTLTSE